ncbi:D-alanyl-D-alanine carboxypeptidase (penicillin-binding protein 5/6) [Pseudobutyrivibrio sp. 49]|uniref:D-alanyl-D-alanine carboxypeptidase family protein n=1 Tax=Pseudobutyrivibrio sp. 49 TaxID=1855344 RepID=UPI000882C8DB|nr:serine hydrolase [Pseudobutyrivibrio sp. 49]SDI42644.1 D-alanyl-D-alanine carboxypeptidase (penicillin-binding protein 5/6) [Pseudobutyrivibrio sp. 49]
MRKSFYSARIVLNLLLSVFVITLLMGFIPENSIYARAASYTISEANGTLLSCNGTEVFADADPSTYVTTLTANKPVLVTGLTSNGYWRVDIGGSPFFISQQALSMQPNTTAYKLTSMDAKAALVMNLSNGKPLYSQGATDRLEPASTTKMMTALLTIEAIEAGQISLDTPVMVSATSVAGMPRDASHVSPRIQAGEVFNVDQLLTAMMVSSDCHSCNVLAELIAGSVPNFVAMMNTRAAQLGCVDTNFTNPSGYPDKSMYTNAYSLYLIAANGIQHPLFNKYFNVTTAVLPATNLCPTPRLLENTDSIINPASGYYNPYVIGGKTGTANRAGQCLVCVAKQNEKSIISVVLGAKNRTMFDGNTISMRYYETNRLINMGFQNYYL